MAKKKRRGLIRGNLERISSKVFDLYHDEITELVEKNHGVYALYKRNRLYYVGLANNLKSRVKHHLRDRHANKWDTFSLYLIRNVSYLRELESLLVHISEPKGNIMRGRFTRSINLLHTLKELMEDRDERQREDILSGAREKHFRKSESVRRKSPRRMGEGKEKLASRYVYRRRFWTKLLEEAKKKTNLHANISPGQYHWVGTRVGKRGLGLNYVILQNEGSVELYIDRGKKVENKSVYDTLHVAKPSIEDSFGESLEWQRLDSKRACRIRKKISIGGYLDEAKWPEIISSMIDAMIRLEKALRPHINKLQM